MTVVAWLDVGGRTGVCARCIAKPHSQLPDVNDLIPVGIEDARGKACVICNLPLAYEVDSPAARWEAPKLDEYGYMPVDGVESLDELADRLREQHDAAVEADADLSFDVKRAA